MISYYSLSLYNYRAAPNDPDVFPFILIGNKVDVEESKRQVSQKKAKIWAKERNDIPYFETSAKDGINVNDAFYMVAKNALKQEQIVERYK